MTVTAVRKDPQALTMTLEAEFDASPERVWQLWADPRQLERWWGPPTYPATVDPHDLAPGGRVEYHMTGPDGRPAARLLGDRRGRAARIGSSSATASPTRTARRTPTFRDDEGRVTIEEIGDGRTRMSIESTFPSTEAMEQVLPWAWRRA